MPRPRKRRRVDLSEIEAMLAEAVGVDLDRLLELIRRVNPSRLDCSAEQRSARYAFKARLQSRVLREFAAEVIVVRTPRPGVIAIRRRGARGDACHAVVDALDTDAREVVATALARGPK
jgi:hypothetical protein